MAGIITGSILGTLLLCMIVLVYLKRQRKQTKRTRTRASAGVRLDGSDTGHAGANEKLLETFKFGRFELPNNQTFEMEQPRCVLELGLKPEEPTELAADYIKHDL